MMFLNNRYVLFRDYEYACARALDNTTRVTATLEDVEIGFKYYGTVSEANELGIPPGIYEVFNSFKSEMQKYPNGFSLKEFQEMYFKAHYKYIGREKAKAFTEALEVSGLLVARATLLFHMV